MGKIFVLSVTDHEEYILSRIMEIIAAEPGFDHIVSSHPCNTLVFPGLELRLKERTVHRNGELISMTHREFATLVYLANHPSWVFSAGQIYEEVWGKRLCGLRQSSKSAMHFTSAPSICCEASSQKQILLFL
jgi:DNA-binding response OmpR family regulator